MVWLLCSGWDFPPLENRHIHERRHIKAHLYSPAVPVGNAIIRIRNRSSMLKEPEKLVSSFICCLANKSYGSWWFFSRLRLVPPRSDDAGWLALWSISCHITQMFSFSSHDRLCPHPWVATPIAQWFHTLENKIVDCVKTSQINATSLLQAFLSIFFYQIGLIQEPPAGFLESVISYKLCLAA